MTGADSIVTFIMYFTIENPDVKMLRQMEQVEARYDYMKVMEQQ